MIVNEDMNKYVKGVYVHLLNLNTVLNKVVVTDADGCISVMLIDFFLKISKSVKAY